MDETAWHPFRLRRHAYPSIPSRVTKLQSVSHLLQYR